MEPRMQVGVIEAGLYVASGHRRATMPGTHIGQRLRDFQFEWFDA